MTFWIIISLLLLAIVLYVAAAARRVRLANGETPEAIYAARSIELAEDLRAGVLDATEAATVTEELARNALHEIPSSAGITAATPGSRRAAFVLLCVIVPAIALPLYLLLGTPGMVHPQSASSPPAGDHLSMQQMVEQLQARIDEAPKDPEARLWMARVLMATEQYAQAVDQYAAVIKLAGEQPDILVQYADALAMMNGGRMAGRPLELVERALAAQPKHLTALWLAGLAAQEAGDLSKARDYLERARSASIETHQPTDELDAQLASLNGDNAGVPASAAVAQAEADSGNTAETPSSTPVAAAPAAGPSIAVDITLEPALAAKIDSKAILFVVAKMPSGMPMPLAVKRLPATGFPLTVILDDSLAMAPTATLSSAKEVDIIARISQGGQPIASSGDLQGKVGPVVVGGASKVAVVINEIVP